MDELDVRSGVQELCLRLPSWIRDEISEAISNLIIQAYTKGRAEAIAEVMPTIEFYASPDSMSCRLRSKHEDKPKCLQGDTDYFQDPADLPLLQDGGNLARALKEKLKNA